MERNKNRIQYVYSCTNAFFNYFHNSDLDILIKDLERIQKHADENIGGEGCTLWFKFGNDDTLATDIGNIINDLSLHGKHPNRLFLLDNLKRVTKDINPDNELRVFYS